VGPADEYHPGGYYLKTIWTLDSGFNVKDVVEGIVTTETAAPSGTPLNFRYEDGNNLNYLTRILDQRNCNLKLTYGSTGGATGKVARIHKYVEGIPGTEYEATNLAYNTDGTLQTITDPNSKTTTFSYNPTTHILTSITPPGVSAVNYTFDNAGRLTQIRQKDDAGADNRYTDISRDWLGRITQITYPQENTERLTVSIDYDATDLFDANASYGINVIDTNGIKTQYLYNSAGLLWKVVEDRGQGKTNAVTTFAYDAFGNLVTLTDAKNQATTFTYDTLDRLETIRNAQNGVKSFVYYPDNSLRVRYDEKGQFIQYRYDSNNRLDLLLYQDVSWVLFTYEPNGLLKTAQRSVSTVPVTFGYDAINRFQETNGELAGDVDKVTYAYHNGGQRQSMISSLLGTTTYDLKSNSNALWKITRQSPQSRLTQYSYNQYTGNLSRMDRANNTYTTFDFDNLDRLKSYTTHLTTDNTYVYDYVSDDFGSVHDTNLIQQTTYPVSGTYYQYNYDDLYRLGNEYGFNGGVPAYTKNYEYDLADNRSRVTNGTVDTYTVNNLNEVTAIDTGNTSFQYDLNGNLTQKTANSLTSTLQYDYENRLVRINYPSQAGGGWTEFVYDALGRRLKTIEKNSLGQITGESHCVYDGLDLIADLNGLDTLVAAYTHGPGFDDPLICRYNNADYYYHTNHQGSVTELLGQSGGIVKTYRYDAFGNILQETGPAWNRGFTYTGRERHARSGLYYYRARFYDPQTGRFISQDPIGQLGGTNLYTYVLNNPVNWYDPLGLLTYVVADDIVDLAKGDQILRFNDRASYEAAIAKIPKGETEIIVIAHGEKEEGGEIGASGGIIRGTDISAPLIKNKGNFSRNVSIDLRVCNVFKNQSIKCELMRAFPEGTITGYTKPERYWLGAACLLPYVFSFESANPYYVMGGP
jgi:RHS repeat-associated protein